ncbi:MAG: cytochrome c [Rhodospirillales bacterium]|nr:cytochrome c [Acetobacter sp.]
MRQAMAVGILVALTTAVAAQNIEVIEARQKIYKGFGSATKPIAAMLKGEAPYDPAAVKTALTTYAEGARKLPDLFPDDSKKGHDTEALPAIWDNKQDFNPRFAKLAEASEAAMTAITDEASFKATMPKVLGQCGGCHKQYRAK